jgi:hypothetical protein
MINIKNLTYIDIIDLWSINIMSINYMDLYI